MRRQALGNSKKFWIAVAGPLFNLGLRNCMKKTFYHRLLGFYSDSRKSKTSTEPRRSIQNRKLVGIVALVVALGMCGVVAEAQQAGKIPRIGFLERSTASGSAVLVDAFRQELSKLGWIEGKNITIEVRFADQKLDRLAGLAAELARLKVDVIVTGGSGPTLFAKKATATIPIVMAQDPDPVGNGFVVSLARPGGNVTGFSSIAPELNSKRLEILKDTVSNLARVGILQQQAGGIPEGLTMKEVRPAALALKLKLEEIKIQLVDAKGLESAFQTAKQKQVNAIMWTGGRGIFGERKRIVELAGKIPLAGYLLSEGVCR
jgi:putative tryptophan/tyrosine transport system substrate-binding protein